MSLLSYVPELTKLSYTNRLIKAKNVLIKAKNVQIINHRVIKIRAVPIKIRIGSSKYISQRTIIAPVSRMVSHLISADKQHHKGLTKSTFFRSRAYHNARGE